MPNAPRGLLTWESALWARVGPLRREPGEPTGPGKADANSARKISRTPTTNGPDKQEPNGIMMGYQHFDTGDQRGPSAIICM